MEKGEKLELLILQDRTPRAMISTWSVEGHDDVSVDSFDLRKNAAAKGHNKKI